MPMISCKPLTVKKNSFRPSITSIYNDENTSELLMPVYCMSHQTHWTHTGCEPRMQPLSVRRNKINRWFQANYALAGTNYYMQSVDWNRWFVVYYIHARIGNAPLHSSDKQQCFLAAPMVAHQLLETNLDNELRWIAPDDTARDDANSVAVQTTGRRRIAQHRSTFKHTTDCRPSDPITE